MLDSVSSASDLAKLETIYELTLDALKATANQRPLRFEREGQPPPGLNTELMVPDCDDKKKLIFLCILSGHSFRRELEANMRISPPTSAAGYGSALQ